MCFTLERAKNCFNVTDSYNLKCCSIFFLVCQSHRSALPLLTEKPSSPQQYVRICDQAVAEVPQLGVHMDFLQWLNREAACCRVNYDTTWTGSSAALQISQALHVVRPDTSSWEAPQTLTNTIIHRLLHTILPLMQTLLYFKSCWGDTLLLCEGTT